ncbi:MAG: hypothetical protein ACREXY_12920, partial [Gammaproteobacteria bacterium]
VRNLSPSGACLNVASALGIPEQFDVFFEADRSIRACRLVWHKEKQVGVEFAEEEVTRAPRTMTSSWDDRERVQISEHFHS